MSDADLLIAIPTFNRGELVEIAVRSLMQQANESARWKILVVNNNSTDDTEVRLGGLAAQCSRLTYVFEPEPGLSHARNRAVKECKARYVLFADDECKFPSNYVDQTLTIIDKRKPKIFGGPVLPWYSEPPPTWFKNEYGSYSLPYATSRAHRISLSGANIGFEREALIAVGCFDPALGMKGNVIGYGEETAAELRILARFGSEAVWYDADFFNYHLVQPAKYQWRSLLGEHFRRGVARAKVKQVYLQDAAPPSPTIPECLSFRQAHGGASRTIRWQNIAYERGLPLVRHLGYVFGISTISGTR